jgi:hypothetical protein
MPYQNTSQTLSLLFRSAAALFSLNSSSVHSFLRYINIMNLLAIKYRKYWVGAIRADFVLEDFSQ